MLRRASAILLVLALSAASAHAQVTTTTTIPPRGCRYQQGARVMCGMSTRLEAFREVFRETFSDDPDSLGPLYFRIVFRLQKTSDCLTRAGILCVGSRPTPPAASPVIVPNVKRARAKLRECIRPLRRVPAKLRSRAARRRPPEVIAAIAAETAGIASDLEAVRAALTTCP